MKFHHVQIRRRYRTRYTQIAGERSEGAGPPCRAAHVIYGGNKWDHCRHGNRIPEGAGGGLVGGGNGAPKVLGFGGGG